MPLPILAALNKRARAAYPFIRRGVKEGMSANSIQNALIASGMGIARSSLLKIVRAERDAKTESSKLKFLGMDRRPDPRKLPLARTIITRKYAFIVKFFVFNEATLEDEEQYITVSTDNLLTRSQIENTAITAFTDSPERYPNKLLKVQLDEGMQAGVLGTVF